MILGVPADELAWLGLLISVAGVATGFFAGLFGVGGGAVAVPVLYEVFRVLAVPEEVRMQLCVGTSLAIMAPTTLRSYLIHRGKGIAMNDVLRLWIVPAVMGVGAGSIAAALAPGSVFRAAFAVIASAIGVKLLFGRDAWRIAGGLPGRMLMSVYGFLIGLASSLIGISGGSLANLFLTLHGRRIHDAVAISAGITVPIAIAGAVGYALAGLPHEALLPPFSLGFVSLIGMALIAPLSILTAPYGARLAHALSKRQLEIAFGLFLLAAAARFAVTLAH